MATVSPTEVRQLTRVTPSQCQELACVLIDCVDDDASISFMHPLDKARATAFWTRIAAEVEHGTRLLLVAEDAEGIAGTVQVALDQPENQPHRADLAKMLVHRRARRRGIGAALMRGAEQVARAAGKTLLVLDTASDDARRLYQRMGWQLCGTIPDYALLPRGGLCSASFYYRQLY